MVPTFGATILYTSTLRAQAYAAVLHVVSAVAVLFTPCAEAAQHSIAAVAAPLTADAVATLVWGTRAGALHHY